MVSSYKLDLYRFKAGPLVNFIMDLDFTLRFEVKDGKFRIDAPIIKNIGVHRFMIPRMVVFANPKDYKEFTKNNLFSIIPMDLFEMQRQNTPSKAI